MNGGVNGEVRLVVSGVGENGERQRHGRAGWLFSGGFLGVKSGFSGVKSGFFGVEKRHFLVNC